MLVKNRDALIVSASGLYFEAKRTPIKPKSVNGKIGHVATGTNLSAFGAQASDGGQYDL